MKSQRLIFGFIAIPGMPANPMGDPENNPDVLSNGKNVVFIHGFNESPEKALGNICETFKRFYWTGSKAKFTGVEWFGDKDFPAAPHYHRDVTNAFLTAPAFANYIKGLQGEVNVVAFSLGNMVVSSAIQDCQAQPDRYFMLHAAVAKEAYDANEYDADMIQIEWRSYSNRLYASKWHDLFPSGDARSTLAWPGRFDLVAGANVYNYYSSGEDVLAELKTGYVPWSILQHVLTEGRYAWVTQEFFKGRHNDWLGGSWYGGWEFNRDTTPPVYGSASLIGGLPMFPTSGWNLVPDINTIATDNLLKTKPVFKPFAVESGILDTHNLYLEPDNPNGAGSLFAQQQRPRLLAEMIPALSFATGSHVVDVMNVGGIAHNFNMQHTDADDGLQNGWPAVRGMPYDWHHGDYKTVAYVYVYKVFDDIGKTKGQFDQ